MENEHKVVWYALEEFPNSQYEINKLGEVRNNNTKKLLTGHANQSGYLSYTLTINGKVYTRLAHLMVAKQFIPNPNGYPIVNHKDENKMNPCIDNLEWVTHSENSSYGSAQEKSKGQRSKPINEYSCDGQYIRTWKSAKHIYLYYGLPYDSKNRTTYLVRILTNNDNPDYPKMVFANRIFMRYNGNIDNQQFVIKKGPALRNETYRTLAEPQNVPDEYTVDMSVEKADAVKILLSIIERNKREFSTTEISAMRYAIDCIEKIHDFEEERGMWLMF